MSFVTPARVRLTEAVRHLIDAALTAEEADAVTHSIARWADLTAD